MTDAVNESVKVLISSPYLRLYHLPLLLVHQQNGQTHCEAVMDLCSIDWKQRQHQLQMQEEPAENRYTQCPVRGLCRLKVDPFEPLYIIIQGCEWSEC